MTLAVEADAIGALTATGRCLSQLPFKPDGFVVWIRDRRFQVDYQTPRLNGLPPTVQCVHDLTPPADRRKTFGQQVIAEMDAARALVAQNKFEECRERMSVVRGMYEAFRQNPRMMEPLSIIERIDLESGAKALQSAFNEIKPQWLTAQAKNN